MIGLSLFGVPGRLPDDGQLRAAAWHLQNAADTVVGYASVTQSTADSIGPGVWADGSSGHAKAALNGLAGELGLARTSLSDAATALQTLAQYVAARKPRHDQLVAQLAVLERNAHPAAAGELLSQSMRLTQEISAIERDVSAAMARAADSISRSTARTSRHTHGHSIWSRIGDFASGVWDGTYEIGKGLVGLAVLAAKLSPQRMMFDPAGYLHDLRQLGETEAEIIGAFAKDPRGFIDRVGSALIDRKGFDQDKVHWAGELLPTIASMFAGGAGAIAKAGDLAKVGDLATGAEAAEGVDAAGAVAGSAARTSQLAALAKQFNFPQRFVEHVLDGHFVEKQVNGKPVRAAQGFHSAPGGIAPDGREVNPLTEPAANGTYRATVKFFDPEGGSWSPKDVPVHTMFPDSWSSEKVLRAISDVQDAAGSNHGNVVIGTHEGVKIRIIFKGGEIWTAYPISIGK